ncbi:nSTAND1 domain-containing NTPase [Streptomyces sp. NPDC002143]
MGRPERPVDPAAGPVQRLAHELRLLRGEAGGPSYREMAQRAQFSVSALSRAAAGERLPSLAVVLAYVRACGADPTEWEVRWRAAQQEAAVEEQAAREDGEEQPPYQGLVRFDVGDHGLFFGRDRLVGELSELVREYRFAVVFGPSGSGKSSLLRAGLVPLIQRTIQEEGCAAVLRVLTPGDTPAATHGRLIAPEEGDPDSWVVVDQFEEVFTLCRDQAERARFLDLLLAARKPNSRLRVVIAVRADFYGRCMGIRELADALRDAQLHVGPMSPTELWEAIVKPATAAGLVVERELTARVIKEVIDQPGGLPLLSHALLETWRRRRGRILTMAAYETAGGVHSAIAATAEQVYRQLSLAQTRTARQVLLRLIVPGDGAPDTQRPVKHAELQAWVDPAVPVIVERLVRGRLLTVDDNGVELAHEALINNWPRLYGWIEEDRERLRHHRRLTEAARIWAELGHDPDALYRGSRLAHAEELFPGDRRAHGHENWPEHWGHGDLTAPERAFLDAAVTARDEERKAATRVRRRIRRLVIALAVLICLVLTVGVIECQQKQAAEKERARATAHPATAVADPMRRPGSRRTVRPAQH